MTARRGLSLSVYRNAAFDTDCTNGGITATADSVILVGTKKQGQPIRPLHASLMLPSAGDAPQVVMVENYGGPVLVPLEFVLEDESGVYQLPEGHVGPMAGGNYAGTSDSRFGEIQRRVFGTDADVLRVHDRIETVAQYRALSI